MIAGNCTLWKGAPSTNLTTVAVTKILQRVLERNNIPGAVCSTVTGGTEIGKLIASDENMNLVSFTGSTAVGRDVGKVVQGRFGKSILELGGNNAVIVHDDADLNLALRGIVFSAAGTCGQRCTTTRRLILHKSISQELLAGIVKAYSNIKIGNPLQDGVLVGPLHNEAAVEAYNRTLAAAKEQGGKVSRHCVFTHITTPLHHYLPSRTITHALTPSHGPYWPAHAPSQPITHAITDTITHTRTLW